MVGEKLETKREQKLKACQRDVSSGWPCHLQAVRQRINRTGDNAFNRAPGTWQELKNGTYYYFIYGGQGRARDRQVWPWKDMILHLRCLYFPLAAHYISGLYSTTLCAVSASWEVSVFSHFSFLGNNVYFYLEFSSLECG